MKNKNILISGAGIAGLTLAYFLKQFGFTPTLVERHPKLRTGGYKIDIRGVALDVIKRMGIHQNISAAKTDIQGATIIDATTQKESHMSGDLAGSRSEGDLEIMRGDLCQILLEQLSGLQIIYGDSITRITQSNNGVNVEFEKNQAMKFDLVIGADGLHSTVRKLVFGEESKFLKELGFYISVYTIPNFLKLDRWEIEYFDPRRYVNVYSTRGDRHAKAGFAFSSKPLHFDPHNTEEQKKLLQNAFADVGWEVPTLLDAIKEAPDFYFDSIAQIWMPHWTKGRVALVGDAGYAPSPMSGQGTSVAIVGAFVLAGELAEAYGDYEIAFTNYEKLLRHFIEKNQNLAQMSATIMSDSKTTWLSKIHQYLMQMVPQSWIHAWIHFLKKFGLRRIKKASTSIILKNYSEKNKEK